MRLCISMREKPQMREGDFMEGGGRDNDTPLRIKQSERLLRGIKKVLNGINKVTNT